MFWRITGTDAAGKPATVYIQGTIHLGDDRLYPLSVSVQSAWNSADRVAGEISTEGWAAFQSELQKHMIASYTNANGSIVTDNLTDAQKNTLYSIIDKTTVDQIDMFEPWVLNTSVSTAIYMNSGLSQEKAMDSWFIAQANNAGRHMDGLDELETQFAALKFGNYSEQISMLQDTLDTIEDSTELDKFTNNLYEGYLAGDVKKIASLMEETYKEDMTKEPFYKDYYRIMYDDRNKAWAEKITSWISEGGTTFIFAGCAHFVGKKSVFTYLKKTGAL